jgi:hypothetical protein
MPEEKSESLFEEINIYIFNLGTDEKNSYSKQMK